jgi:hypothetical protein
MNRTKWNDWLAHGGDGLLATLHDCEEAVKRAIHGIWLFLAVKMPEFFKVFLASLHEKLIYACKVAIRLGRLGGLMFIWLFILGAPIFFFPGILTGLWTVLALFGSYLGLRRVTRTQHRVRAVATDWRRGGKTGIPVDGPALLAGLGTGNSPHRRRN